ncbi:MAG: glycosyltransferase [Peptostreptococcaceae bacterium]
MKNDEGKINSIKKYEGTLLDICNQVFNIGIDKIVLEDKETLNTLTESMSYYYELNKDEECLSVLKQICDNSKVDLDVRVFIYWQLIRIYFINNNKIKNLDIRETYENIFDFFNEKSTIKNLKRIKEKSENNVVLITNQFLGYEHSPTKILMNIAKMINEKYEKIENIYIFNSTEMPTKAYCNFHQAFIANYINEYEKVVDENIKATKINRCKVYYKENEGKNSILARIEVMAKEIYDLNPKFIISIGGSNLLADLCNNFMDVYTFGTNSEMPIAKTKYLVNFCNEKNIIKNKIRQNQFFIGIPNGFYGLKYNKDELYTKEQFGIKKDLFLISVVGNRLSIEITDEFIEMIKNILSENENAGMVIIGSYNKSIIENKVPSNIHDRIYSVGYINNLYGVLNLTDLYLNPNRKGGGYSALYSIMCNKPVLSLDRGDVASYLSDYFKVKDYEEMYKLATTLINNNDKYEDMCDKTNEIYYKYKKIDWDILIDYILNNLD